MGFLSRMATQEHTHISTNDLKSEDLKIHNVPTAVHVGDPLIHLPNTKMYSGSVESKSLLTYLSVSKLDRGSLFVKGVFISPYCSALLIIMSVFLLIGGVLLTAIAYRPKEMREELGEWTDRLEVTSRSRIGGPVLVVISLVILVAGISLVILKRMVAKQDRISPIRISSDLE